MKTTLTQDSIPEFFAALKAAGGRCGNEKLRRALDWNDMLYWTVQADLLRRKLIRTGRGRGGAVMLADPKPDKAGKAESEPLAEGEGA